MPDAHNVAIREIGDPMIEFQLYDGKLSDWDQEIVDRLERGAHKFRIVTYDGCDRAFLVATV